MTPAKFIEVFDTIAEAPGGVERLRELVLQLAVRGKLVPQDEGNEPARRLLEQIAEEKKRLERAKEIGQQKPVPPMEDSATTVELPAGWTWTCTAALGIVNPRNVGEDEAMVSFCPMPTIPTDYGQQVTPVTRRWGDIKKGYTHFADGDVVVAKITPCFQNRKSCVMNGLEGGIGAGTTELHVIRIIANKVVPEYLMLFFKSPDFLQMGVEKMTGTAGQQRVPREYFAYTPLPLPPLAEQHRIVAKVDELMGLIDRLVAARRSREDCRTAARDSALAVLRNASPSEDGETAWTRIAERMEDLFTNPADLAPLRKTVLQLAVRGRLVPQDPNEEPASVLLDRIAEERAELIYAKQIRPQKQREPITCSQLKVPEGWKHLYLGDVIDLEYGKSLPHKDRKESGGVPVYGSNGVVGQHDVALVNGPCIVVGRKGSAGAVTLSRTSCWPIDTTYFVRPYGGMSLKYTALMLLAARLEELDRSTAIPGLNREEAYLRDALLPPLAEQHRIVPKVDELMELNNGLEQHLVAKGKTQTDLTAVLENYPAPGG